MTDPRAAARPVPVPVPAFVVAIGAGVGQRIAALLDADLARWRAVDPDLDGPLRSLRDLVMAGGKRLRPAFCHWAFVGRGGDPADPRVVEAGAALELLHISALIHDDVIDGSQRRRGMATVHAESERRHAFRSWRGDPGRFGEGTAILVGDMASVYADILLGNASRAAIGVFDELRLEVNAGQLLDLLGSARDDASPQRARQICRYKSAKYTVERPLHLGAALADPAHLSVVAAHLTNYGLPLGEAFQLKDDLLGTFGDPTVTGKPVGEDLREGKPTLLYALARDRASGEAARLLAERYGAPDLTADEVIALQEVFEATGARAQVEATVDGLVDHSLEAAAALPVTDEAREALIELAYFVSGRDH
jgi:geranylgeranyl diphosphate synthase type I